MSYIAKVKFADLTDGKRLYLAGETFPRDGLAVSDERLAYLAGSDNLAGYPLIEKVDDETPEPTPEPVEKPTRKRVRRDAD